MARSQNIETVLQGLLEEYLALDPLADELCGLIGPFSPLGKYPALSGVAIERMFSKQPSGFSLRYLITNYPDVRDRAWEQLKVEATNADLVELIKDGVIPHHVSHQIVLEAAQLLLIRSPSNAELCCIITYVKELREEAARRLLTADELPLEELCCVLKHCDSMRSQVWQDLCAEGLTANNLSYIAHSVEALCEPAWRHFLSLFGPVRNSELCVTIAHTHGCWRYLAAQLLLTQSPSNKELCCVVEHVKELRELAARRLLAANPDVIAQRLIYRHVPALRDPAASARKDLEERMWDHVLRDGKKRGSR